MCNLYSYTRAQAEALRVARALRDNAGNLPPLPSIFPDQMAPVIRTAGDGVRELLMMRWGFPSPPGPGASRLVTNVRNVNSNWWKPWLLPGHRCLVPATSFCEYHDTPDPKTKRKIPHWFALSVDRPIFFFAGIWRAWTGTRGTKAEPIDGEHLFYSFLTCDANAVVKPVHAKAMPVILTTADEIETWLTAPFAEAIEMQRPLANDALSIVAIGEKQDAA